jgi:tetratricopeptide (TPR) repeat protein
MSSPEKPGPDARREAKEHFSKGNEYAKTGQFDAAISEYIEAVALDPDNSNTYENLAISYAKTGNFTDAVKTMQTAIRLSPSDSMKYSTLGIIYHADNKLQRALEQYIQCVRLNPGFAEIYYNIAVIYSELGSLELAHRAALQAQILGYPGSSKLLLELKKNEPDMPDISAEESSTLHLRHIITSSAEDAEHVLGRLREGEDFIQLASRFSNQPYNLNGGYVGPFAPNELMEKIAASVVPLTPLAFSHVIETTTGYHIFQKFPVDPVLLVSPKK